LVPVVYWVSYLMRALIWMLSAVVEVLAVLPQDAAAQAKPNIVLIVTDDLDRAIFDVQPPIMLI
jgi:hypothetical protein